MKKNLLFALLTLLVIGCKKKKETPLIVPPAEVSSVLVDSMRIAMGQVGVTQDMVDAYNNKTYVRSSSKINSFFSVGNGDLVLTIDDTSVVGFASAVQLKFPGKNVTNISGTYSFGAVTYNFVQGLGSGSFTALPGWNNNLLSGTIQISFDAVTQTMSGTITDLRYPFGVYLPRYIAGNTQPLALNSLLQAGGSFRKHNISFKFIREKK